MGSRPDEAVFEFLRNSSNSADMNVDGSSTPVEFTYVTPSSRKVEVSRLNFIIIDGAMGYGEFAGLGSALTNGITIKVEDGDGNAILDFYDGETIKANEDFNALAGIDAIAEPAAGDDSMPVRWTLSKAFASGGGLNLWGGESIVLTVRDNLSAISKLRCMLQGRFY